MEVKKMELWTIYTSDLLHPNTIERKRELDLVVSVIFSFKMMKSYSSLKIYDIWEILHRKIYKTL